MTSDQRLDSALPPWVALYDPGLPADIVLEHDDALSIFRTCVAELGDRPLAHYFDVSLSARTIDDISDAIACAFLSSGLREGDRIALYMQNVPQYLIALVASWKIGGVAVGCNPMLRDRELNKLLRDSGARACISLEALHDSIVRSAIADTSVKICLTTSELDFRPEHELANHPSRSAPPSREDATDLLELAARHAGEQPPLLRTAGDAVAVLTYTSGTTGPSKGAMNTHRCLAFSAQTIRDWTHTAPDDVVLGAAPLFHVTGLVAGIGLALSGRIPLVLSGRFKAAETARLIERYRATTSVAALTAYLALSNDELARTYDLSSLTKALSGGAPVPAAAVADIRARTGLVIRNAYGLTETTGGTHSTPLGREGPVDPETGALSVGLPMFGTDARIVDDEGNELPAGAIGEIAIRGPQVVPGYWSNPEETAAALSAGEFRTGDMGKIDNEGWLYVVDRRKDLIIASGYKVWPREVEDVLYEHSAVREAAVVGVPDGYRGETIHAYVSFKPGAVAETAELIEFCRRRLAAYKCPREIAVLHDLPKTATGKILRRELRQPQSPADGAT